MKLLLTFLFFAQMAFAQTPPKTITVQGMARTKVRPDIAFVSFRFEKTDTSSARAMANANSFANTLTRLLQSQGLPISQIKIAEYAVNNSYNPDRKRKEYSVSNTIVARLLFEEKQLDKLLEAVQREKVNDVDISFEYALSASLQKSTRDRLVQEAIARARNDAENISQTLKVPLKNIVQVSKNGLTPIPLQVEMAKFSAPVIKADREMLYKSAFAELEVEGEELEEVITIVYEIGS